MSTTIDQHVVEMRFDNKHFEQNVSTTLSTLEKLKQKLNFSGAAKGLDDINTATKKVDMNGLGTAVDAVQTKFSALQVMGVTTLANITNSAVNAGKKIVSALTIDPIKTGFQEYETQINAVQTILANTSSKGTTIDDVNKALEELNKYADKTIYNFTEMTRNIGTFTAAGVDLDTSVSAIQGIANLAAVSGSTSQQASTAMYQLSQALATGTVKLMDWNSVVNAGMGGEVFQNALVRTAAVMNGAAGDVDAWRASNIDAYGSFRDSLTEGAWLTSEVLTATLEQFTMAAEEGSKEWDAFKKSLMEQGYTEAQANEILKMANTATDAATKVKIFTQLWDVLKESVQSGWSQTWKLVIGDFEDAKALLTPLADTLTGFINKMSDARNRLVEGALDFATPWSGITKKLEGAGFGKLKKVAETIEDATDKLERFQEIVNKVWRGEFGTSDTGRFKLLEEAGFDSRVVQDLVDKGADYKITIDDIEASHKKFGLTMDDTSSSTTDLADALANLSDKQLEDAGLTKDEIKLYRDLAEEAERTGVSIGELADEMSKKDGRTLLIESFKNAGEGLVTVFTSIKEAWVEIFPPMSIVRLYNIIKTINEFSQHLKMSDETADNLKKTFKGVFAVVDILKQVFGAVLKALVPLFGGIDDLGRGVLGVTASWGDWLVSLSETIRKSDILNTVFQGISKFIQTVITAIVNFGGIIKDKFAAPGLEMLHALFERVSKRMSGFGDTADETKSIVVSSFEAMGSALANCEFFKLLKTLWNGIKTIGSGIASALGSLTSGLIDKLGNANFNGIFDFINSLSLAGIAVFVAKFVKGFSDITDSISSFKDDFLENVIGILDSVKGCFEAYQSQLKAGTLLKIASAIAILAAAILVISLIDSDKLSASLGAITVLFADLMGSMAIFGKVTGDLRGVVKASAAMISISVAVLILASALKKIGDLKPNQLFTGLVGVLGLTAMVVAAAKVLGSGGKTIIKGAAQMIIFAAAIKILASVCKDLSALDWNQLGKGLVGVGVLLAEVSLFLNTAKFGGKSITTATGIVILAAAIKILASSCADFGRMSWGEIGKGLASIGALLLEIAAFTRLTGNAKHVISTGIALIAIGAAMKIFTSALGDMSKMTWDEIGKGLASMAGSLLAVAVATKIMPKNMVGIGVGLIAVSTAIIILANSLAKMSGMGWDEIARGLVAFGGSLLILALGLKLMNGSLSGSAALIVAAGAIAILTPSLLLLGRMDLSSIVKGLVAIAGAFAVLGIAGLVLGPLVPTILALSGAFALIGIGVIAAGAGLMIMALGVGALSTALATGATAIVAGLTVIITGLAELIPSIVVKFGEAIIALCNVIAEGAPALGEAIKALLLTALDVLVECAPEIATSLLKILTEIWGALAEYTPKIVDFVFDFLIGVLDGVAERLPELIQSAVNVIMSFFSGIIDALSGIDVDVLLKGIAGVGLMSGIMIALSAVSALVPGAMIGVLGMGAVIAELALVLAAIGALAQIPGLDWLINEGGQLLESIGVAIGSFIGGIVGGVMSGISGQFPQIGTDLSEFMSNIQPFIEGAKNIDSNVMEGVSTLAGVILTLTAANVLEGLTSWLTGGSSLAHFGEQLPQLGADIAAFAQNLGGFDESKVAAIVCAANAIKSLAQAANELPNEGGWAAKIFGDNSISAFGAQLPQLATHLNQFATNLGTFDETKLASVTCAANSITKIADAANKLPNEGGWAAKIFGDNSLATFASKLPELGTHLNKFASNLGTFDETKVSTVTCAANAISLMSKAAESIDGQAGWAAKLFGDNSLASFGGQLASLGTDLKQFASNLGTFDEAKVTTINSAVKAVNALSGLADADLSGANKNLGNFGDKIVDLAKDVKSFCSNMPAATTVNTAIAGVKSILSAVKDMSSIDPDAATKFTNSLKNLGKDGVNAFVEAFTSSSAKTDVKKAGTTLITQVIEGVESKISDLKKSFTDAVESAASAIKTKANYTKFYNAGSYLVDGFAAGISENDYKAEAKAAAMARAAAKAAEEALDINSPSKVFKKIGSSVPEGFVMGIDKLGGMVKASSSNMSDLAVDGVKDSLSHISDIITNDIDAQPVIRPVLDLSSVESKAGILSNLFSSPASMGVLANIGAISSMMNSNQNGSNDDVVSAIDRLCELMDVPRGDTYQINGVTYDDGSNIKALLEAIITQARIDGRV